MVFNVLQYLEEEKENRSTFLPVNQAVARTAAATGIGEIREGGGCKSENSYSWNEKNK